MRALQLRPITLHDANAFVRVWHRHSPMVRGCVCCLSAIDGMGLVRGVAIIGRPVARGLQDGETAEVTRLCTDGCRNACSFLYGAAWRAARALGYRRLVTYLLATESGASLRAAGWLFDAAVRAESWSRRERPRTDKSAIVPRVRWVVAA